MEKCKACQCAEELENQHHDSEIAKGIGLVMAAHMKGWHCECKEENDG